MSDAATHRKILLQGLAVIVLCGALLTVAAGSGLDFEILYGAGAKILRGDLADLYPADLPPAGSTTPFHVYRQPPVAALFLAPFALLPLQAAALLFGFLKLAGMGAIVYMVMRRLGTPNVHAGSIFLLSLLGIGGYFVEEFRNGNTHLVLLWMIVAAVYLDTRGRGLLAGVPLAVAACVKLTPLIYVPYFLLRRRWRVAAAIVVVVIALFALPSLIYGADTGNALLRSFVDITVQKTVDPHNYSLRGAILKYFTSLDVEEPKYGKINVLDLSARTANVIWWVSVGAVGFVLAACTRGPQQRLLAGMRGRHAGSRMAGALGDDQRTFLEASLWTTALLLASPHTQRLWFTSLFFPFAVMLALIAGRPDDPRRPWIISAWGASFLAGTLLPPLMPGREAALGYEVRSPYLFATIWVFAVLARLLWPVPGGSGERAPGRPGEPVPPARFSAYRRPDGSSH